MYGSLNEIGSGDKLGKHYTLLETKVLTTAGLWTGWDSVFNCSFCKQHTTTVLYFVASYFIRNWSVIILSL